MTSDDARDDEQAADRGDAGKGDGAPAAPGAVGGAVHRGGPPPPMTYNGEDPDSAPPPLPSGAPPPPVDAYTSAPPHRPASSGPGPVSYGYGAPPPVMSPADHAALDDCCPSCRAEYPSLIRRLLRRGGRHAAGCRFETLPLRLVAGLGESEALLLLADRQARGRRSG